jgi:hypothetical protein
MICDALEFLRFIYLLGSSLMHQQQQTAYILSPYHHIIHYDDRSLDEVMMEIMKREERPSDFATIEFLRRTVRKGCSAGLAGLFPPWLPNCCMVHVEA